LGTIKNQKSNRK